MHEQEPQPDHDINFLAMLNFTQPAVNNVVSAILLLLCWGGCHYSISLTLTLTQRAIPFVHEHTFDLASNHPWKCSRLCRGNTVINSAVDTNNLRLGIVSVVCITVPELQVGLMDLSRFFVSARLEPSLLCFLHYWEGLNRPMQGFKMK